MAATNGAKRGGANGGGGSGKALNNARNSSLEERARNGDREAISQLQDQVISGAET